MASTQQGYTAEELLESLQEFDIPNEGIVNLREFHYQEDTSGLDASWPLKGFVTKKASAADFILPPVDNRITICEVVPAKGTSIWTKLLSE